MVHNFLIAFKLLAAVFAIAAAGGAVVLGADKLLKQTPERVETVSIEVDDLSARVTALDSALSDFRLYSEVRFTELSDTGSIALTVGRQNQCLILEHLAGQTFEHADWKCLRGR